MDRPTDQEMWEYLGTLPKKWADPVKSRIAVLEMRLKEERAKVDKFQNNEKSNVYIPYFRGELDETFNLPKDCTIHFVLGENHYEWVECRIKNGKLYLMAGDSICLEADSSNTVYVAPRDRYKEQGNVGND